MIIRKYRILIPPDKILSLGALNGRVPARTCRGGGGSRIHAYEYVIIRARLDAEEAALMLMGEALKEAADNRRTAVVFAVQ